VTGDRARSLAKLRHLVDVPALLVARLFDRCERGSTLTEDEFLEAILLIESYILRDAICGYQTRGYWQIFAAATYRIGDKEPLTELKVVLARQRENYRFPSDEEFARAQRGRSVRSASLSASAGGTREPRNQRANRHQ
jgi:hypothetical protein